jgi:5-methylcytosine-specific restriction protein B
LSYEDFVEGLKPKVLKESEDDSGDVGYEIKRGIFKEATTVAIYSAVESSGTEKEKTALNFAEKYDAFVQMVRISLAEEKPVELKTWTGKKVYVRELSDRKSMWIFHGKEGETKHTVSRQRLIKLNNKIKEKGEISNINKFIPEAIGGANYSAYYAAWKAVDEFTPSTEAVQEEDQSVEEKADIIGELNLSTLDFTSASNHVLIIDEINRGNVSAILGELITLLEPDKRLGAREALTLTLPYSREEFGVPPNLHIIGTMNTADRSVEALDAALRRRFTFREVGPDPGVITNRKEGDQGILSIDGMNVNLAELLTLLNRRIKALKDADHQIGHSYFLRVNDWQGLASAFNDRIIPLLREYFFANYGQLQLVVGKGFCAVETAETTTFAEADEEVEDYAGDYKSYRFPAPATEVDMAAALRQLGLS